MIASDAQPQTDSYRVEVSGWDEDEIFFVERSFLSWDEFAGKHISLQHMLPEGAIIFVRMLQPTALRGSNPVPYEVQFVSCNPDGFHEFRLSAVKPRYSHEHLNVN
jgi:hypothetical protein